MSADRLFEVLAQIPVVIGLAFLTLALCLGLALLLGRGQLHSHAALTLSEKEACVSPWISIHVQTWRRWAAYHGDPSLERGLLTVHHPAPMRRAGGKVRKIRSF